MRSTNYTLETDPAVSAPVPAESLDRARDFFDTCRRDPPLARDMARLDEAFRSPSIEARALEMVDLYEGARRRGLGGPEALERYERREGAAVFRDYLVLALGRKAAYDRTHDPDARGEALAEAFRVEEAIRPLLDRVDRELFRTRFMRGAGMRFLDDEEWDRARGEA